MKCYPSRFVCLFSIVLTALLVGTNTNAFAQTSTNPISYSKGNWRLEVTASVVTTSSLISGSATGETNLNCSPGGLQATNTLYDGLYGNTYVGTAYATNYVTSNIVMATQNHAASGPTTNLIRSNASVVVDGVMTGTSTATAGGPNAKSAPLAPLRHPGYCSVLGKDGNYGFVKESEMELPTFRTPEERLSFFTKNEGTIWIDVYDNDLATVIDSYPVSFILSDEQ